MSLSLRELADMYDQTQRVRIAAENRLRAMYQGKDETEVPKLIANDKLIIGYTALETEINNMMEASLPGHPCYVWLMGVPGINRTLATQILGMIDDPMNYARFSNLRTFAGLTPGKNKLVKGQKACYHVRLKKTLYVAFSCMIKTSGRLVNKPNKLYTDIYGNWRNIYAERHGSGKCDKKQNGIDENGKAYTSTDDIAKEWPDLRQHFAAKNKLLDVFLFHIYEEWLANTGQTPPTLYVHEVLGHHAKFERADFSNPVMSAKKRREHSKNAA